MQARVGKRDKVEALGSRVIRPFMPDQHRRFLEQLPFLVLGSVDDHNQPWATLLPGKAGFVRSPTNTTLEVKAEQNPNDPALSSIKPSNALGILGIELDTRRRNRVNGRVVAQTDAGFALAVDQSFGNCPRYIRKRTLVSTSKPVQPNPSKQPNRFHGLPSAAQMLIGAADTFFVTSFAQPKNYPNIEGVDVSHRGGQPGFVALRDNTLLIPDFSGNNHFNTLGNFLVNPKAGLVFPNFQTGDLLQLTGTVELLEASALAGFRGAERGWRFTVQQGQWLPSALPFQLAEDEHSPSSADTDNWQSLADRKNEDYRS